MTNAIFFIVCSVDTIADRKSRLRLSQPLDALGKVDLRLVTHAHGDYLGDAPDLVKKNNALLWALAGLAQSLVTLDVLPSELSNRMSQGGFLTPFGASDSGAAACVFPVLIG